MPWNSAHICVALLLLTVVSAVIFAAVRRPYLIAGWLWFLVMLLPVAGFIQIGVQGRASRYMYLPIIGLLLIAIWGVKEGAERLFQSRWRLCRRLMFSLGVAWVLSCAAASFRQTGHWHDSMRFYTRELKIVPNDPYFHTNIAYHLVKKGEYDTAITHCSRALAILPDLPQAHLMLANIYGDLGERERASYHKEQARRDR